MDTEPWRHPWDSRRWAFDLCADLQCFLAPPWTENHLLLPLQAPHRTKQHLLWATFDHRCFVWVKVILFFTVWFCCILCDVVRDNAVMFRSICNVVVDGSIQHCSVQTYVWVEWPSSPVLEGMCVWPHSFPQRTAIPGTDWTQEQIRGPNEGPLDCLLLLLLLLLLLAALWALSLNTHGVVGTDLTLGKLAVMDWSLKLLLSIQLVYSEKLHDAKS